MKLNTSTRAASSYKPQTTHAESSVVNKRNAQRRPSVASLHDASRGGVQRHASRGYIFLMSVLIIGVMLMGTTISLLLLSWANEQNGVTFAEAQRSLAMARSCAEQALLKLQADMTYAGGETITLSTGSCTVQNVQGSGPFYRTICAMGTSGRVTRRLRVEIQTLYPSIIVTRFDETENLAGCGGVAALTTAAAESGTGSSASSVSSASSSSQASIGTNSTLIVLDVSSTGSMIPVSGLATAGVDAVAMSGTSAILAGPTTSSELQMVNVTDARYAAVSQTKAGPSPGLSVSRGKGQLLMGAQKSSASGNGRFRLWLANKGGVSTSSGPWDYTTSGSALKITADPTGCYAFVTTSWATQGFQVVKIKAQAMTAVSTFAVTTSTLGTPVTLWHDPARDRVYLVTTHGFTILGPTSSSPSCP